MCLLTTVTALPQAEVAAAGGKKRISFNDVWSGNFSVKRTSLQWTSLGGKDGNYVDSNADGDLVFSNIVDSNSSTFVALTDISEAARDFRDYTIQASG